jgi:3-oxoacyl-[acyl-carrier protein] reductase
MKMLKDKIMLITGASRGIGKAAALLCAENGAHVLINYLTSDNEAMNLVNDLVNSGHKATAFKADVSKEEDVKSLFMMINSNFGHLDILVNNAGVMLNNPIMLVKNEEFEKTISTNCFGPFLCTRYAIKMMLRQKFGRIINIASIVGIYGSPGQAVYSGSKAFIIGFTKSAAKELGRYGITVNVIAPGLTDTELTKSIKKEMIDKYISNNSLGRIGTPEDVAKVVLFLASDLGSYITGHVICVDGGQIT